MCLCAHTGYFVCAYVKQMFVYVLKKERKGRIYPVVTAVVRPSSEVGSAFIALDEGGYVSPTKSTTVTDL